jgi:hypothetical protein
VSLYFSAFNPVAADAAAEYTVLNVCFLNCSLFVAGGISKWWVGGVNTMTCHVCCSHSLP